ncbi:hypothetical protein [Pseudonocardia xishanensis]|uniref:Uncharacterized protein n=1 Tax=Pseudonocardia xishanensis TaxID=630995 RepID=A0ABP8RUF1_9PSEU
MGEHRRGPSRVWLSPAEADRLLDGGGRRRDLRRLLDAAAALGSARELRGESGARAAFAAAATGLPHPVRTPRLVAARTIIAVLALAGTATGGVAIAASRPSPAPATPSPRPGPAVWVGTPAAAVGDAAMWAGTLGNRAPRAETDATRPVSGAGIVEECTPAGCGSDPAPVADAPSAPRGAEEPGSTAAAVAPEAPGQARRAGTPAGPRKADPREGEDG